MKTEHGRPDFPPLAITTFEELQAREAEVLERVHSLPNGGRLMLLNPLRCLRELNVSASEEAIRAWERASGEDFTSSTVLEAAYNGVAANPNPGRVKVTFRRLLPARSSLEE